MKLGLIKLFLRMAIAAAFLSAVADRFGWWAPEISVWGTWENFLSYTQMINPWIPLSMIPAVGWIATIAEIVLAILLIVGFKTSFAAKCSGILLLLFAMAMVFSTGIKGALDYSVFTAAAAAFALSVMHEKFLELDSLLTKKN